MFSENLTSARKAKGITQEELAVRLNVVRQTISKWEKGLSVPDADLLIRLSEILDVPVSKLLGAKTDFEKEDTDTMAEQLSRINEQLADKARRNRRFIKIILTIIGVILGIIVLITVLQLTGTELHGKLTLTEGTQTVAPIE